MNPSESAGVGLPMRSTYRPSIHLSGIYIYPIKSAAGIAVDFAAMTPRGLQYDRRWMIASPDGKFMTQRQFPQMALIQIRIDHNALVLSAPKLNAAMSDLSLPLHPDPPQQESDLQTVEVWGDRCLAWSMGEDAAFWLSNVLNVPCQLVYMPDESDRPADHGAVGTEHQVSFADAYPYLLISEASLADLNQRLDAPIAMNRFRPNLVVSGCEAFAEDTWNAIRIGEQSFQVAKACSRCTVTTVDQATGERFAEPLKTLATYRYWDGKIWFGQNLIHQDLGTLSIGDSMIPRS
ncbi:MAG: MOSC N-terminal beta barrel domain-containing protein [Elainellaceae cyanobacterium]